MTGEASTSTSPLLTFPSIQTFQAEAEHERRDAAEHRQQILAAARLLMTEQDGEQVSMQQIAKAAHVGQGTLYRRFPHKGYLCMALLEENILEFECSLLAYFTRAEGSIPIRAQLDYTLHQLLFFTETNIQLLREMGDAFTHEKRARDEYQSPFYGWMRETVLVLLRRGCAQGELPLQDCDYMTDVLLAPLSPSFYCYQRQVLQFSPQRIAEGMSHFLRRSIGMVN